MENNLSNYLFDNLKYQKIRNIVKSDSFKEKVINFKKINSKSLMNNRSRAFLHELITVSKSTSILEIGTYFAGGTKVWADAVKKNNGAKILSSISKNTDYLIIGEKAGSKAQKAKLLGVKILDEKEFLSKIIR